MNYDLFDNATSSPESACGASPPVSSASLTTRPYGPAPALANLSARQAKAAGSLTSGTFGPRSTISLSNRRLRSSLASKLLELTATLGSTLYRLTWTQRVMPSGLLKPSLRASARRTSDPETIGWRTPTSGSPNSLRGAGQDPAHRRAGGHTVNLQDEVTLACWPAPTSRDHKDGEAPSVVASGRTDKLPHCVQLAGWPTATATDSERRGRLDETTSNVTLNLAAQLSGWPTASASDDRRGGTITEAMSGTSLTQMTAHAFRGLTGPARLTVGGVMRTGCDAATKDGGQLSPTHSLWLMLGPFATAWASCGERVMRSRSGKRRASLRPSSPPLAGGGDA